MTKKKEKIMIVDGNALVHRSFHALPLTISTQKGEITNAVYGFTSVLIKSLKDLKPDYAVCTFDLKAPTFRHEKYEAYKATRVKAPDELYLQLPRIKEVVNSFGIPIYEKEGYEADDLIGTIAKKIDLDIEKYIVTGDMDTLQLIDENTFVYTLSRGLTDSVTYDKKAVFQRFGLRPDQMVDFKALRGDPSDNIPGVKGIGEKTAAALLANFGTLDALYQALEKSDQLPDHIRPRIAELLTGRKQDALLSKELAQIYVNVPISFDIKQARFDNFNKDKALALLNELEFKSLIPRIIDLDIINKPVSAKEVSSDIKFAKAGGEKDYRLIDTDENFNNFKHQLDALLEKQTNPQISFDTETTGTNPLTAELIGISFSWQAGEAFFVLIPDDERKKNQLKPSKLQTSLFAVNNSEPRQGKERLNILEIYLDNPAISKVCHNAKYDLRVLQSYGIRTQNIDFDTMIASYALNPGSRQHNLDAVVFSEIGHEKISKTDLIGKGRNKIEFAEVDIAKLSLYSCEDADYTLRLAMILKKELSEKKLLSLFENIEMPLVSVLADMENTGIKIDGNILAELEKKLGADLKKLETDIWSMAGSSFNINSTQQLKIILFEKIGISTKGISRTKTGISTSADQLNKLKDAHPIIPLIQEYRELAKLKNTYIDALPRLINPLTGRVHTSFNQAVTATGRLSSTDPNLQNIPIRTEIGREIRRAFVAEEGFVLASLDYSQIELRVAAHMSGDPRLIRAFQNNEDIHALTAAEINNVPLEKVSPEMRREAKAINFGVLYGQGASGLSQTAGIPYAKAKSFIENYFSIFKEVKDYIDRSIEKARETGRVETIFGRQRIIPDINSSVANLKSAAERTAVNTPLQGTAADMIKLAMIKIANELKKHPGTARMLLQVHDELVFEIKKGEEKKLLPIFQKIMQDVIVLKVPVVVDIKIGANWGEMIEFQTYE